MNAFTTITTVGAALGEPTRVRLLMLLQDGAMSVGRLALVLDVVPSVVCHHVGKLEDAGLVSVNRPGSVTLVRRREDRWRRIVAALGT